MERYAGGGSEHERRLELFIGRGFVREEIVMPKRDGKNNPGDRCCCLGEEAATSDSLGEVHGKEKRGGKA